MARGSKAKKRQDALFDNANEELTVTKKPQRKAAGFELLSMQQEDDIEDDSAGEENELKPESKKKKKNSRKKGSTVDTTEVADAETVEKSLDELNLEGLAKKKKKSKKSKSSSKESSAENLPSAAGGSGAVSEASEDENAEPGSFVRKSENLTATGILLSHERSKDIQIDKFSVAAFGHQLVSDTSLTLLYGKKYGLCGRNGCGKSTLLRCLAHREVPIQSTVDLYLLEREYDPTELTAVEAVVDIVKTEKLKLEQEMDELLSSVETAHSERIDFVQERLNELDLSFAEQKARQVLKGLEFTEEMQDTKTKEFSGGWRMRVALARALFVKPTVLLLDGTFNHLYITTICNRFV